MTEELPNINHCIIEHAVINSVVHHVVMFRDIPRPPNCPSG